ncbi:MAG: pimeloyl-ACP methyl ester esterase BioH [bacterium]|nr:pimeloyl-ACP methyl ester esterase BioH [bacterium]
MSPVIKSPDIFHQHFVCSSALRGASAAAPHLVLLHGWGMHSGVWENFLPLLAPYFQVTVIDLPGFGKTAADISPDGFLHALPALVPAPALWLGWSLGGLLALEMAMLYPQRVRALCLLAATPCFVQREDWLTAMPASVFGGFCDALQEHPQATLARFLALQCKGSVSMKADIRFLQAVLAAEKMPSDKTLGEGLQQLACLDLREALRRLAMPVQVILGEKDSLIPVAVAGALQVLNPAVNVTVVDGAAHLPFVSHPQVCRDALLQFCRQQGLLEGSAA